MVVEGLSVSADQRRGRVGEDSPPVGVEGRDEALDEGRRVAVVVARERVERTAGVREGPVGVGERADVARVADDAQARVAGRGVGEEVRRGVGGGVVAGDDLEAVHGLPEQVAQGLAEVGRAVVDGQADGDARRAGDEHGGGISGRGSAGRSPR